MYKNILLMLLLVKGSVSYGQNSDKAIGMSFGVGYHRMQMDNLNEFLMANGLHRMKTGYLNLWSGLFYRTGEQFVQFTADIDENKNAEYNADGIGTSSYSFSLGISVGYIIPIFDHAMEWVPYAGFSTSRFYLSVSDIPPITLDFQSMLATRTSVSLVNRTNAFVFGSRFIFPVGTMSMGLDVSYGASVFGEWTHEDSRYPVPNAPYIDTSRFKIGYFFMFTAWGTDKKKYGL